MPGEDRRSKRVWPWALGAAALSIAVAIALRPLGRIAGVAQLVMMFAAGIASTATRRARLGDAVVAFVVAAILVAVAYDLLIEHVIHDGGRALDDTLAKAGLRIEQTSGPDLARTFGLFGAIMAFVQTAVVGVAGAAIGAAVAKRR